METNKHMGKEPMSQEVIFKLMVSCCFVVSAVFFIKNIFTADIRAILVIGLSLLIFVGLIVGTKMLNADVKRRQFLVSLFLQFMVFVISLFSGDHYSDDFLLYLAVIGLTGLYMRPKYAIIQTIAADILLILQYVLHPEKAEELPQYIMCMGCFTLTAFLFYQTVKRGRAFIERSQTRAEEAEQLLNTMADIGIELQNNFESSTGRVADLKDANARMEKNTSELQSGSSLIAQGAKDIALFCGDVQETIKTTENQIGALNNDIRTFENALSLNRSNLEDMNRQMEAVKKTMEEANEVFRLMNGQMENITRVTQQLNSIASSTTMLSLNASIEAARAGKMGAGFAVVASKVQDLAVDSTKCSNEVDSVVGQMHEQVDMTTKQLSDSAAAIDDSLKSLTDLQGSFDQLTTHFQSLYTNIEEQNTNVTRVDAIFDQLKDKIMEMSSHSEENQSAVGAIAEAIYIYKNNIRDVLDDTEQVHQLSASMLDISQKNR